MCNCLNETDNTLAAQSENTQVDRIMFFDGTPSRARIASLKAEQSNRKRPMVIIPNFCPFCGEKYPEKPVSDAPASRTAAGQPVDGEEVTDAEARAAMPITDSANPEYMEVRGDV